MLVRWATMEHHTIGFRQSEQYQDWKRLLHYFYEPWGEIVARRYNPSEMESLLERIRYNLKKQTDKNGESYMELEDSEDVLILKVRKKKSPEEKLY